MNVDTRFSDRAIAAFAAEAKVGLLATVSDQGAPHLSLITTIQAKTPQQLIWGQFCEGYSKKQVLANDKTGFLVMNADRELWRGKARWTHDLQEGEDYESMNQQPMFRYNSYFGIHTVHYMDLINTFGRETLSLPRIISGSLIVTGTKFALRSSGSERPLTPWAESLINKMGTMKFICYIGEDGYPVIVPLVPCAAADSRRLVFSPFVYHRELAAIPEGTNVAMFALNMEMESVLVRGVFAGYRRPLGPRLGAIEIDWVYNTMPPVPGQIYPQQPLQGVTEFE